MAGVNDTALQSLGPTNDFRKLNKTEIKPNDFHTARTATSRIK